MKTIRTIIACSAAVFAAFVSTATASWTIIPLPDADGYQNTALGHLADGRFLYGHNGKLIRQDTFGAPATTAFATPPNMTGDYGYVTSSHIGETFGGSYSYDSTNPGSVFTAVDSTLLTPYAAVSAGGGNLLMTASASFGPVSGVYHISSSGVLTTLVADFSPYSGGIALDSLGNLYVAYAGSSLLHTDGDIFRYSAAQVAGVLSGGSALLLGDAEFVVNLGVSGSLAVDVANNRLYAAGYQEIGIQVHDLVGGGTGGTMVVPGLENTNYQVTRFSDGSQDYIGWVNRSGYTNGSKVYYGYNIASAVPEPSSAVLLAVSGVCLLGTRRRKANQGSNRD